MSTTGLTQKTECDMGQPINFGQNHYPCDLWWPNRLKWYSIFLTNNSIQTIVEGLEPIPISQRVSSGFNTNVVGSTPPHFSSTCFDANKVGSTPPHSLSTSSNANGMVSTPPHLFSTQTWPAPLPNTPNIKPHPCWYVFVFGVFSCLVPVSSNEEGFPPPYFILLLVILK